MILEKKMKNIKIILVIIVLTMITVNVSAHCEIPCGIYEDSLRISLIREHVTTIEKSMNQILKLEKENNLNYNQLVRWINNKEVHAEKLQNIVTQYFMTQRIKVDAMDYNKKISTLHKLLIYSMKSKQTTDLKNIKVLRSLVDQFEGLYIKKK